MRILLLEPDQNEAQAVRNGLAEQGYSVDVVHSTAAADEAAVVDRHDVILLFSQPPACDGPVLCRSIRQQGVVTPILVVSRAASVADRVAALDAGADDCLAVPFDMGELAARVRTLLRRSRASEGSVLRGGNLVIDLQEHQATVAGAPLQLSRKEIGLLELMLRNPGRMLTRTLIGESVWNAAADPNSNVIDVYVSSLRRKLAGACATAWIETVIGCGYRFVVGDATEGASNRP